jgi:hypothetical protein
VTHAKITLKGSRSQLIHATHKVTFTSSSGFHVKFRAMARPGLSTWEHRG